MKKYTAVLFDLDGTILDTNELIIRSFLESLSEHVGPNFTKSDIIPHMGQPLRNQIQTFTGLTEVDHLVAAYRKVNFRLHDDYVKLFPNVKEVIDILSNHGIKVGVVTTKMRMTTEMGLALTGINHFMDAIITLDDVTNAKPHAEPIQKALELLNIEPHDALMVGDSLVDIESGIQAGVDTVGVAWSLKGKQLLKDAGATYIIDDMTDLLALVGLERNSLEKA